MSIFKRILLLVSALFVFTNANAQPQVEVLHAQWDIKSKKVSDCEYDIVFSVKIDHPWHIFSIVPTTDGPNATTIKFTKSPDFELVGKLTESKPKTEYDKMFEATIGSFEEKATFTQRIKVLKAGKITLKGKYEYQICTESMCEFPLPKKFTIDVEGAASCAVASADSLVDTAKTAMAVIDTLKKDTAAKVVTVAPQSDETQSDEVTVDSPWWAIFIAGFAGGWLALLTPCVFPMIPMNVSFFTKQSKTKKQGIRNALIYSVSIIVLYVALGLIVTAIFGAGALHTLSTNVWFNLFFFLLLVVFAASFLGAFEISLPSSFVNKVDSKSDKGGLMGIFFMAFTLALVSFSCTGPIIGTLLVEASSAGNYSGPFWGMFGFSLALALPFGVFAAFPGWLNSLPKSGGWLNAVKVTLGFLELALALKFASNADLVVQAGILTREVFITIWIVIFALLTLYLLGLFKTSHDSDVKSLSVTRIFFVIFSFAITVYLIPGLWGAPLKLFSGVLPPLEYSESPRGFGTNTTTIPVVENKTDDEFSKFIEVNKNGIVHFKNDYDKALAYAKKVGKPLMVDFTGHACANCRKTEDYVWPDPEIVKRLNNDVVLVSLYVDDKRSLDPKDFMKVNWYGEEYEITDIGDKFKYMQETKYKQSAQPLYVILDHNEQPLNAPRGYKPDIQAYIQWMDEGITKFKSGQK
ncbi:MAG TPA: cytochrome c biogenesis protein CcdA [Bacteroidia bacterium]